MGIVDYPVFLRVSSINVAADMIAGLEEVDSGKVWRSGNPERPPQLPRISVPIVGFTM